MGASHVLVWVIRYKKKMLVSLISILFVYSLSFLNNGVSTLAISSFLGDTSLTRISSNATHDTTRNISLQFKLQKHVSPLASITQRMTLADPPLTKTQINELYRTSAGLEKISLDGVNTWREFGVIYIPHNMSQYGRSELADVYNSDYDPYISYNHTLFFEGREHKQIRDSDKKIILARMAGMDDINGIQPLKVCPEFPCVLTTNFEKYFKQASAVSYNAIEMKGSVPKRRPDQIFIFYNYEPLGPTWGKKLVFHKKGFGWGDAFNWTMSHHLDADIFMPYGLIRKRPTLRVKDYSSIIAHKVKLVIAFVSHCTTIGKREAYIRQLQRYVPVDVYGACGTFKCDREKDIECYRNISKNYKFYLAFENALCEDYITEKFFKNLQTDAVLIARGGRSYYKYVPEDIYINTGDFESPKALAERLKYLDRHDEEYLHILRKKDEYFAAYENYPHVLGKTVWVKYNWENVPLCEVCQRLWNIDLYTNVYPDIGRWFNDRLCLEPTDV